MKKFIIYALFVLTCGLSIYFGLSYVQSSKYEETAVPYIRQTLPIISTWDASRVQEYMSAEVLEGISADDLDQLMGSLSALGQLQSIEEINFKNKTSGEHITRNQHPLVVYDLDASYSSGAVKVSISLLDNGDSFEIYHFNFQSEVLAPAQ